MLNSAKLAELQNRVSTLEAELKTATEGKAGLEAELNQAKTELATAQAKALDLEGQVTTLTGANTQLTTDLAAANQRATEAEARATAAEASIDAKVTERLAAAGVDPIKRDPSAKAGDPENGAAGLTGRDRMAAAFKGQLTK